jgi:1-acyl-sn-glycerol-3-phosphate acyltransferase
LLNRMAENIRTQVRGFQLVILITRTIGFAGLILLAAGDYCVCCLLLRQKDSVQLGANWLHAWAKRFCRLMGIVVNHRGFVPLSGLIVANHLSYVDVIALASLHPMIFVAKADVKKWPLFGVLIRLAGTVFIDRCRPRDAVRTNHELSRLLERGVLVTIFPEGTTSDGRHVLPFKPALFDAAIRANADIVPAAVIYSAQAGRAERDICYWGDMTFVPHLFRLFRLNRIVATVAFSLPAAKHWSRRDLASFARRSVVDLKSNLEGISEVSCLNAVQSSTGAGCGVPHSIVS